MPSWTLLSRSLIRNTQPDKSGWLIHLASLFRAFVSLRRSMGVSVWEAGGGGCYDKNTNNAGTSNCLLGWTPRRGIPRGSWPPEGKAPPPQRSWSLIICSLPKHCCLLVCEFGPWPGQAILAGPTSPRGGGGRWSKFVAGSLWHFPSSLRHGATLIAGPAGGGGAAHGRGTPAGSWSPSGSVPRQVARDNYSFVAGVKKKIGSSTRLGLFRFILRGNL